MPLLVAVQAPCPPPDVPTAGRLRLQRTLVWAVPMLATLVVGLISVGVPELWRDELATWSVESRSLGHMFRLLGHADAVSGTYYLFMHFWTDVAGTSALALRSPSILAMAGAAAFTALTGQHLMTRSTGVVAGIVFATLPTVSRFAQEARGYGFTVLAVSAATWLLLRAVDSSARPLTRWAGYGAAIFFVGAFNLVALCVLVGHAAVVLLRAPRRRDALIGWLLTATIAGVALTPLVLLGISQAHDQIGWVARPTWGSLIRIGPQFVGGILLALVLAVAAITGVIRHRRLGVMLLSLAVLPILVALLLSVVGSTSYWIARYLLFTLPAWCVLAASAVDRIAPRLVGLPVVAIALCGLPGQIDLRTPLSHNWANYPYASVSYPGPPGIDYRGAARLIAEQFQPGDGVIGAHDAHDAIDTDIAYYLPSQVQPRNVFVWQSPAALGSFYPSAQPNPTISETHYPRLWLVTIGHPVDPPRHLAPAETRFLLDYYVLETTTQVARDTAVQLFVLARDRGPMEGFVDGERKTGVRE